MNEVTKLHREAMAAVDQAILCRKSNNESDYSKNLLLALRLESAAAQKLFTAFDLEPTRSILFRSAATLALDCKQYAEARKLAHQGLAGLPPRELADELEHVLEQASFEKHLSLKGIALSESELQLSIAGSAVGPGLARADLFMGRVATAEKLLLRTAERRQNLPYRDSGKAKGYLQKACDIYLSAPRSGSLTVTLKLGQPRKQEDLFFRADDIIDEFLEGLELVESRNIDDLRNLIGDESYYTNFIALGRKLAPDGDLVRQVSFTRIRRGKERSTSLIRATSSYLKSVSRAERKMTRPPAIKPERLIDNPIKSRSVEGVLRFADAGTLGEDTIKIVPLGGSAKNAIQLLVPPGLMNDIVRPLWNTSVIAEYHIQQTGLPMLINIEQSLK